MTVFVHAGELRQALLGPSPTDNWRWGKREAFDTIKSSALTPGSNSTHTVWVVDPCAWSRAMNILARLPSGGRHVWEARTSLSWRLDWARKSGIPPHN